jgi:hypothetical protein
MTANTTGLSGAIGISADLSVFRNSNDVSKFMPLYSMHGGVTN